MAHEHGLPGVGESQEIGQDATRCLYTNAPKNWVPPKDLGGTDDYGLDFQVQLKVRGHAGPVFRVQLKGTKSPAIIEEGRFVSIPLSTTTLRYYRGIPEPILLVVCDLSGNADPRQCPLYYVWVRDELRRIQIDSLDLGQQQASLRVPTSNRLTYDLDLLPEVLNANELAEAGHALDMRVADLRPELQPGQRVEVVRDVTEGINKRSAAFLEAVAAPVSEHWPKPEPGSLAADLIEAARLLRTGKEDRAIAILDRAEAKLKGAVNLELGEYHFLRGRQAMLSGNKDGASAEFFIAAQTTGASKYWAAWAESELRRRFDPDRDVSTLDLSDTLAQLPEARDAVIAAARARLLAASHKADEARAVLAAFSGADSMAGLAVVEVMNGEWDSALEACDAGLADPQCSDSLRHLFRILRARSRFHKALTTATQKIEDEIAPPSGPPGADARLLKQAWSDILEAVESMDEIGWTSNSEFVADILAACAAMLGRQEEALTILRAAVQRRPNSQALNASLEVIAAQRGQFALALEANNKLERGDTQLLRRIASLYEVGRRRLECVALMEREISDLSRDHQLFGSALVLASRAAHELAREDLVRSWSAILEADKNLRPHAAVLEYHLSVAKSPLSAADALTALARRHEELGRPLPTAITLFEECDPSDERQAPMLLGVEEEIRRYCRLAPGMAVHLGMALVTLREWDKLLHLCDEAEREFDGNPRLVAFKGLALDRLGDTQGARQSLKAMLDGGIADSLALRTYVNIMVRCGFFEEALATADQILATANSDAQRRDCIRLLFTLVQTRNPRDPRLIDLAIRMGEIADPANEVEEGVFLTMMLLSTCISIGTLSPDKQREIGERTDAFFERFPDSKILGRINANDASGDELVQRLKEACGITEERQQALARIEREMRDGKLPIPFAWRPKLAFPNIRDPVHLWELAKGVTPDDKQFHLVMEPSDWHPKRAIDLWDKIPLVDLTTLFVLLDLGLLDALFEQFKTVAIAQGTLADLSALCQAFSGSPCRDKCLDLQGRLRERLGQIAQPINLSEEDEEGEAETGVPASSREIKALCLTGRYFLYSDDVLFRVWCLGEAAAKGSMSTLDLLHVLEERGVIDRVTAARAIAKLCAWKVGVTILLKYQLALVPQSASEARNIFEGVEQLRGNEDFMAVANGMWDFRSDFLGNLKHVAAVLRELVNEPSVATVVAASFVGVWYLKAKIRPKAPHPPLRLLTSVTLAVVSGFVRSGAKVRPEAYHRMRQILLHLVELEFGDRMDEAIENEAYRELARHAAEIDANIKDAQLPLLGAILAGFEKGTAPYDTVTVAYNAARAELASRAERESK